MSALALVACGQLLGILRQSATGRHTPGMSLWKYTGGARPDFAVAPGPNQESVWDYPRPPVIVDDSREIEVLDGERRIAATRAAVRVLETASPPTFYLPPASVADGALVPAVGASYCEWKGAARYWSLAGRTEPVAWSYPSPSRRFARLRDYLGFYPGKLSCFVDGERVRPQPGGFYGGWLTAEIVGPVKGEPGTGHW